MSNPDYTKRIVIIAGPNGAGKTTFAREFLPTDAELPNCVNADLIAAGLSPFAPDLAAFKAARIMLETIADYVRRGESFSFETTLSGLTYVTDDSALAFFWLFSEIFSCLCLMSRWLWSEWQPV